MIRSENVRNYASLFLDWMVAIVTPQKKKNNNNNIIWCHIFGIIKHKICCMFQNTCMSHVPLFTDCTRKLSMGNCTRIHRHMALSGYNLHLPILSHFCKNGEYWQKCPFFICRIENIGRSTQPPKQNFLSSACALVGMD